MTDAKVELAATIDFVRIFNPLRAGPVATEELHGNSRALELLDDDFALVTFRANKTELVLEVRGSRRGETRCGVKPWRHIGAGAITHAIPVGRGKTAREV